MYSRPVLLAALLVTTVYVSLLSLTVGWIVGHRIGDETGVIGWTLGGLAFAAGILYGIAA